MTSNETIEFLYQSNLIEGIDDPKMLGDAITAWEFLIEQAVLTTGVILKTHKILMKRSGLFPHEKGYFRRVDVWVGGHKGREVAQIPGAMKQWVVNTNDVAQNNQNEAKLFLDNLIKDQHVQYEKIHPFVDGNGRTGRMLMNWTRLKCGLPLLIIKASERQMYYSWFRK